MTTTFDKREEGFEKQFAHDEELRFKAIARRNKMLGLWAAGILGSTEDLWAVWGEAIPAWLLMWLHVICAPLLLLGPLHPISPGHPLTPLPRL